MNGLAKYLSPYIVILVVSSLLMIEPIVGQSIPKPSVPQFTVTLGTVTKDYPAVYSIDPYTGENVMKSPAAQMKIKCITVTIQNPPFTPYKDPESNNTVNLFYEIRVKGHFEEQWRFKSEPTKMADYGYTQPTYLLGAQFAEYDIFKTITPNGTLDFQVQTLTGYYTPIYRTLEQIGTEFHGEVSGWSTIQTITIDDTAPTGVTISPSQTVPTPTVPEFPFIAVVSLFALIPLIAIFARKRICLKAYN